MKKLFFLFFLLLLMTGCSATYNLEIKDNSYIENIDITLEKIEENAYFESDVKIPVNKNSFLSGDPDPNIEASENIKFYDYVKKNDGVKFSSLFELSSFSFSGAIYSCYDKLNAYHRGGNIIISTSSRAVCFDNYSNLNKITVNITVDKKVKSHDADKVSDNVYTWYLTPDNPKAINLVMESQSNYSSSLKSSSFDKGSQSSSFKDNYLSNNDSNFGKYFVYIVFAFLVIVSIAAFIIFKKVKESNKLY